MSIPPGRDRRDGGPGGYRYTRLVTSYTIRTFGDPVLRRATRNVEEIDGRFVKLVDAMVDTMYEAPGVGLAAPQVGIQQRFFVYDVGDGPNVLVNPKIVEEQGEWDYEEGCLSLPGLSFEIVRPKVVTVEGLDIHGEEVVIAGDELLGRVFLHEIDHLDGVLMIDRLDRLERKRALKLLREQSLGVDATARSQHAL